MSQVSKLSCQNSVIILNYNHKDFVTTGVPIIDVYLRHGIVMVMMTVEMALMNHQNTVSQKEEHVLVICLHVTMETVYHEFTSVMGIMTVWIILMKMQGTSVVSTALCVFLNWNLIWFPAIVIGIQLYTKWYNFCLTTFCKIWFCLYNKCIYHLFTKVHCNHTYFWMHLLLNEVE